VARALVDAVRQAAIAARAIRLSVQTEPGNIAALQLYRTSGFVPVEDIQILALRLIARVWRRSCLALHRAEGFKFPTDSDPDASQLKSDGQRLFAGDRSGKVSQQRGTGLL
jgi:hypothetical protein